MGNTCNGQSSFQHPQITHLPFHKQTSPFITKRITFSNRFRHQIQKLKIDGSNMYKLILPVEGQREQTKSIACKILFSYADMEMCPEYQFSVDDMLRFPIVDVFEQENVPNPQVYHKITTLAGKRKLMKYYTFTSFTDYQIKAGLYQLSLYKRLGRESFLEDYFVLYKGNVKQLVMVFSYCYVSLHDILLYRKTSNYQWTQQQLLIMAKMLCNNLIALNQVGIVHRDIRPSNIFFKPISIINSGESLTNNNSNYSNNNITHRNSSTRLLNESVGGGDFYCFGNLQSARVIEPLQNFVPAYEGDTSDLLTVKGTPAFHQGTVRDAISKQQHTANYDPHMGDISGLKQTLLALVNLQPTNVGSTHEERLKNKNKVRLLLKCLNETQGLTVEMVAHCVDSLLGVNPTRKSQHYHEAIREFYMKQLTISQNIETNLYYNATHQFQSFSPSISPNPSLNPPPTPSLTSRNLPLPPANPTFEYLQSLYIKTLYDLHKKDTFVTYMLEKLARNLQANRKEDSVALLMKVGGYFQEAGVRENQYYKEAILLLLELAEQQRLEGFYKDHERLVEKAEDVYRKFDPNSKMVTRAKCMLLKEKAYKEMFTTSQFSPGQDILKSLFTHPNSTIRSPNIQSLIFQAYQQAQKANLPIEQQLQLIYSKGQLSLFLQRGQQSQTYFFNGYQICERNQKEFLTAHNCNKYKGMFEYAMGLVEMVKIRQGVVPRTPKGVFDVEQKLERARERFLSVTIHPVHVIKCYIALGDLCMIRQDGPTSVKNYQRALNLLHAQNEPHPTRAISARLQLQIVSKLIQVLNLSNNNIESHKYQSLYECLKKQFNLNRTSQKRYSRKGKVMPGQQQQGSKGSRPHGGSSNNRETDTINNKMPMNGLDVIEEAEREGDEENKMFESRTKPLQMGDTFERAVGQAMVRGDGPLQGYQQDYQPQRQRYQQNHRQQQEYENQYQRQREKEVHQF